MVAKTIGTKVSFAWETVAGVRPTSGYMGWCDCTSHPDLNPEADQIETTTLCQEHNHTYEDGLVDFGTLEFGANMTPTTYDLFLGTNGLLEEYAGKEAQGLRLWVCIDIKGFPKSYYVPVKPQPMGLPSGEAGSNKYDLVVRFSVVGDAGWYDDPVYATQTSYTITFTGFGAGTTNIKILEGATVKRDITTTETSVDVVLPVGTYLAIASRDSYDSQVKDVTVSAAATVEFDEFA